MGFHPNQLVPEHLYPSHRGHDSRHLWANNGLNNWIFSLFLELRHKHWFIWVCIFGAVLVWSQWRLWSLAGAGWHFHIGNKRVDFFGSGQKSGKEENGSGRIWLVPKKRGKKSARWWKPCNSSEEIWPHCASIGESSWVRGGTFKMPLYFIPRTAVCQMILAQEYDTQSLLYCQQ